MMLDQLTEVKFYEIMRYRANLEAKSYRVIRDQHIYQAFEDGLRQKEIANVTGLSESTVKHIIAQQKKENEK